MAKFTDYLKELIKGVEGNIEGENLRYTNFVLDHEKRILDLKDKIKNIKTSFVPPDEYFEIFEGITKTTNCSFTDASQLIKDMIDNEIKPVDITNFLSYLSSDFGLDRYQFFRYLLNRSLLINNGITHPLISSIIPTSPPSQFKAAYNLININDLGYIKKR